jgi:hypothetical protein
VRRRQGLVGLVLVMALGLGPACSGSGGDLGGPAGTPDLAELPTTSSTTTTTTAPLPADVQDLVVTTTMTERARRTFLAASPAIEDAATFAASCGIDNQTTPSDQPRTHTQGCYAAGRIHLLAPDRAEARDLLYVVAAHELLHAVYAFLGPTERARIDAEVEAARAGNDRLEERLRPYGSGPTLANEIHSILGSEFDGLSPVLEAHYAQFFTNRAAVVAARQRTLGGREDQIRALKAEVDDLDARIAAMRETQEELRAAGDIAAFNANVGPINALISRYNAQVEALNALIDEYNGLLGG